MANINASGEIDRRVGFKLPCPRCGKTGDVHVNTRDPFGEKAFNCVMCKNAWSFAEIEVAVQEWARVLEWLNVLRRDGK